LRTEHGKPLVRLGEKTKTLFQAYGWPGNVRELGSVLERAIVHTKGERLEPEDFPAEIQAAGRHNGNGNGNLRALEDVERETILVTLEATEYQIGKSAQILGISRKTLLEKRKKFGMK
jgi:DNA-binding NtrC family response regulator